MSADVSGKAQPRCSPLSTKETRITGGILGDRCSKNIENLFNTIDVGPMKQVYATLHRTWYAEPEFCGQYLDVAMQVHGTSGDPNILTRAEELVRAIIANQRADGYLGTYEPGLEFDESFSVWNQNFTIMGLLSWYEQTGDRAALQCAMRCADFLAESFQRPGGPDLLWACNQGIEHACLIFQMPRLYRITGEKRYLDFCDYILQRLEATALKLVTGPQRSAFAISSMGCLKAGELLICYQGLLELYRVTGNAEYLTAASRYWDIVKKTQIGVTGNGSIAELWTYAGNRMRGVTAELFPNENCVAVCWMQLTAALYQWQGEARFMDALEQTLYNHLLGSQAVDGKDFSYYQGHVGRKVHATHPGQYSCCRYRGMKMLAYLPRYVFSQADDGLRVNLYCPSTTEATLGGRTVRVEQQTDYPRSGRVQITVKPGAATRFALGLRIPQWCTQWGVQVNGKPQSVQAVDGVVKIEREWTVSPERVELSLDLPSGSIKETVDDRESLAFTYGPLVLALDTRYGAPLHETEIAPDGTLEPASAGSDAGSSGEEWVPMVRFKARGRHGGRSRPITLVDYASAGSLDPQKDRFKIWLPVAGKT